MSIRMLAFATLTVIALGVVALVLTRTDALRSGQDTVRSAAEAFGSGIAVAVVALETDTDGDTIPDSTDPTPAAL